MSGRIVPADIKSALSAAASADAKEVQLSGMELSGDCALAFATADASAWIPFAGRPWKGDPALVSRKVLARIVRASQGDILVERTETGLQLTSGPLNITLPTIPPSAEAVAPIPAGTTLTKIDAAELGRAILRVLPFATQDQTRPVLATAVLDFKAAVVVACDSYRLMVLETPGLKSKRKPIIMLASKGARALAKAALQHSGPVALATGFDMLIVSIGNQRWSVRTINGKYPDWRSLLPDGDNLAVEAGVDAGALASVSALIADTSNRKYQPAELIFKDSTLTLGHARPLPGDIVVSQDLPLETGAHEELQTGMNPQFLAEAAAAIAPDSARVRVISPLRPMVLDAPGVTHLIMPVRIV